MDYMTSIFLVFSLVIIVSIKQIYRALPILKPIFNDILVVSILVVLSALLYNIHPNAGAILFVLICYLALYFMYLPEEPFKNNSRNTEIKKLNNNSSSNNNNTESFTDMDNKYSCSNTHTPNPQTDAAFQAAVLGGGIPINNNEVLPFNHNNDQIRQIGPLDKTGYDISGCRYDMQNSPQNLTKYGPPLSYCAIYSPAQIKALGSAFYPLNA